MTDTVVPGDIPGDRVVGLSISKDGSVDQHNPSIIGDKETALELTRRQLRQLAASNAHSATDQASAAGGDLPPQDVEDPEIQERKDRNEQAIKAADSAAERIVDQLFDKDQPVTSAPGTEQATAKPAGKASAASK